MFILLLVVTACELRLGIKVQVGLSENKGKNTESTPHAPLESLLHSFYPYRNFDVSWTESVGYEEYRRNCLWLKHVFWSSRGCVLSVIPRFSP